MGIVSVVVPVFNVAAYLTECVDSVLTQSYSAFELILVDDGSTDGSAELCDDFARTDPRIRVLHQANSGLSGARNAGLAAATGETVSFLDGDDWWERTFLQLLVQALDDHPDAGLAMSSYARVPGEIWHAPLDRIGVLTPDESVDHFAGPHHTLFVMACAKVYRREVLDGVTFPRGRLHEDEYTTHRILMRTPVVLVPEPLYLYRQRPSGITGSQMTPERLLDAVEAAEQQGDTFVGSGHRRAAAWAHDQAFRKRVRLVALLSELGQEERVAEQSTALASAARHGRDLPRSRALRLSRRLAAASPRLAVPLITMVGAAKARVVRISADTRSDAADRGQ